MNERTTPYDEEVGRLPRRSASIERTDGLTQSAEELRQTGECLQLLIESVRDYAIFMLDTEGRIVTWNAGAERIKGYRGDEVLGKHFSIFSPTEDVASGRPERGLKTAIIDGRYEEEGWRVRKSGERFWANVVMTAVYDASGRHRGFSKVTQDLTDRRRIEWERREAWNEAALERARAGEARKALQQRDEFIAVAAHELRTPLTTLQLKLQGLEQEVDRISSTTPGALAKIAERVKGAGRQVKRLAELVEQLLDVSLMAEGDPVLHLEETDLTALVKQCANEYPVSSLQGRSELRLHAPVAVVGHWDRGRLEQVVTNLLSNAYKYGAGKEILVSLEATEVDARLTFSDHGIGIPPESIGRIFERYQRAAPIRSYGGMGVGLYLTRVIVEAHGGSIEVSSKVDQGSTFVVILPRQAVEGGVSGRPQESRP